MKNIIVVTKKEVRGTRAFSNLTKACKELNLSYNTVSNYLTRKKRAFENWEYKVERVEIE